MGEESFGIRWLGKRESARIAGEPTACVFQPCLEESRNWDTTRNLFIAGDNLDALKSLSPDFGGRIGTIYIDPPYNTGGALTYGDDYSGENGRHAEWLSMMYPRLLLARDLLSDNGVLFISIDDREGAVLRLLCDEVFGSGAFLCTFVWRRRSGAMTTLSQVSSDHEYVLCYVGRKRASLNGVPRDFAKYGNADLDPRGPWIADNLSAGKPGGDTHYAITDPDTGRVFWPPRGRYWPYNRETMARKIAEGRVLFPQKTRGTPMLKRFRGEARAEMLPVSTWGAEERVARANSLLTASNAEGTRELKALLGGRIFTFPKPVRLIRSLLEQATDGSETVLDFFAGSCTTAHAVMEMNAADGGARRFVMVQLPEPCRPETEAYRAGYRTIAEIGCERMRRAGEAVRAGPCHPAWDQDVGFRVLRLVPGEKESPDLGL